jgi:hypothetical protein
MQQFQLTCIVKRDRFSHHEHITHVGNQAQGWMMTRETVVAKIDGRIAGFFTIDSVSGKRAEVGVVREQGKAPFLRTYADGKWNDNLLSLPTCGSACRIIP